MPNPPYRLMLDFTEEPPPRRRARYPSRFPTTVGIEYTFVPAIRGLDERARHLVGEYAAKALQLTASLGSVTQRRKVHSQDGAVEVPSPVHHNRKRLRAFAENVFSAASSNSLTPRHVIRHKNGEETYIGTGGGHVHVGIPRGMTRKQRALFLRNVAIDSFNRVELYWFFQEWHENEGLPDYIKTRAPEPRWGHAPYGHGTRRVVTAPLRTRQTSIAIRTRESFATTLLRLRPLNTLEFRLFDAPRDISMVERNVDFALAYTMWHRDLAKRGVTVRLKKREVLGRAKWTDAEVERKLRRLFSTLRLRYDDYHETYWCNYTMRKEHGKL